MISGFLKKEKTIAVVGLGYVGLPLAVELSRFFRVTGIDTNFKRVKELISGKDSTGEVSKKQLRSSAVIFTNDPAELKNASIVIVAVPTPIDRHKIPDLSPLTTASEMVGKHLRKQAVVVFESTVYPGVTEDICVPILEKHSDLKCGKGFRVGYSPERVNPGDKVHGISGIVKVVSAQEKKTADLLAEIYGRVVKAGIHIAPDIKTAEAAKVIENIQRDLNIALINELAIIFNMMGIDSGEVFRAASTKWNFLPYQPGLVGGHCIGVDPYYLTFKAQSIGYHPEVILAGRRINDTMGKYVSANTIKQLIRSGKPVKKSKVLLLGVTFKEDISDIRNTKVIDIYRELKEYGIRVFAHDPHADPEEVSGTYGITLLRNPQTQKPFDAVVLAVRHKAFRKYTPSALKKICAKNPVIIDIKSFFRKDRMISAGFHYWTL